MSRPRRAALLAGLSLLCTAHAAQPDPGESPSVAPPAPAAASLSFVPVPEIDLDPNSGNTFGLIGVWLQNDAAGAIQRIYAPDVIHNPYFGWGVRARVFDYSSSDSQWSVVAGVKQHVESEFDALYQYGLKRQDAFSYTVEAVYDRSGSPRFYGVGNDTHQNDQSVYTNAQHYLAAQFGWNFMPHWQLAYSLTPREVTVLPGQIPGIPSTTQAYPGVQGLGTTHEILNRLLLSYDTRDDVTVPRRGTAVMLYGGIASNQSGLFDGSLFSETGFDARYFWSPAAASTLALHAAARYMPSSANAPFWALSSVGGDTSAIGGGLLLRGYGAGRFYDRNAFSSSLELRQDVAAYEALGTRIEVQLAPFVDAGQVFHSGSDSPVAHLHSVIGLGVRALARPSVVGYVDVGHASEGFVAFSGINYPF
jgi:outer membrane protein assembly factor BamA